MKLHAQAPTLTNIVTGYGADYIEINRVRQAGSLILTADSVQAWDAPAAEALQARHLADIVALHPEIVLLGTGARLSLLAAEVTAPLVDAGIGFECMDTPAACRTFNILLSEGRYAVGAFLAISAAQVERSIP